MSMLYKISLNIECALCWKKRAVCNDNDNNYDYNAVLKHKKLKKILRNNLLLESFVAIFNVCFLSDLFALRENRMKDKEKIF